MSSFSKKQLRVTFVLGGANSTFPGTNSNTLILTGNRIVANVQGAGNFPNTCDLQIYGMTPQDMNALSVIWAGPAANSLNPANEVILESNDGSGWFQVFEGNIFEAQPDYRSIPDAFFHVQAFFGLGQQLTLSPPTSFKGAKAIADLAQQVVTGMGFAFENNGVSGNLSNPYYAGTLMDQFRQLCADANIDSYIQGSMIAITPKNKGRTNVPAVILNQGSGLVGYPVIERFGISLTTLFNPAIALGGNIVVQGSDVPGANGNWFPFAFTHQLESNKPNGQWFSMLSCSPSPTSA